MKKIIVEVTAKFETDICEDILNDDKDGVRTCEVVDDAMSDIFHSLSISNNDKLGMIGDTLEYTVCYLADEITE